MDEFVPALVLLGVVVALVAGIYVIGLLGMVARNR
jgi:hypothetical protein